MNPKFDLISDLLTLLDRIEVEQDWELAHQRFKIMKEHGPVELLGGEASSEKH